MGERPLCKCDQGEKSGLGRIKSNQRCSGAIVQSLAFAVKTVHTERFHP